DGSAVHTRSLMLGDTLETLVLDDVQRVTWIHPNVEERGYYRWNVGRDLRWSLADHAAEAMTPRERVGFVNNLGSGLEAGLVPSDETLQMLSRLARDPQPQVVGAVLDELASVRGALVTPDLQDPFALYLRKTLGPALDRVGTSPAAGE